MGAWSFNRRIGRKLFHLAAGSSIPLTALLLPQRTFIAVLLALTMAFLLFEFSRIFFFPKWSRGFLSKLISLKEGEGRGLTGASYLLISSLLLFLIFDSLIASLSLLYLTLGDPAAALVRERWCKFKLGKKSIPGSGAFILAALIPTLIFFFRFNLDLGAVLIGAVVATLVELLPLPLDDNLTVPLISATALSFLAR